MFSVPIIAPPGVGISIVDRTKPGGGEFHEFEVRAVLLDAQDELPACRDDKGDGADA